jgi:hypothetical protein
VELETCQEWGGLGKQPYSDSSVVRFLAKNEQNKKLGREEFWTFISLHFN